MAASACTSLYARTHLVNCPAGSKTSDPGLATNLEIRIGHSCFRFRSSTRRSGLSEIAPDCGSSPTIRPPVGRGAERVGDVPDLDCDFEGCIRRPPLRIDSLVDAGSLPSLHLALRDTRVSNACLASSANGPKVFESSGANVSSGKLTSCVDLKWAQMTTRHLRHFWRLFQSGTHFVQ